MDVAATVARQEHLSDPRIAYLKLDGSAKNAANRFLRSERPEGK
jgi:hypothetical protein